MKAHWWSCVLGLLCMPAEVILSSWTVYQDPLAISQMRVNSSAEITCSTSWTGPTGFSLYRHFHGDRVIVFLSLDNGLVNKNTTLPEFAGRIHITPDLQAGEGYGFTLRLSLLRLEDTDLYYCRWSYYNSEKMVADSLSSNGTIIVVRERDPQEQCKYQYLDLILFASSVAVFTVVAFLFIGALVVRCKRFKKRFRPARAEEPSRPNRPPQHVCHTVQHSPYLITSTNTLDFRGIL